MQIILLYKLGYQVLIVVEVMKNRLINYESFLMDRLKIIMNTVFHKLIAD